MRYFYDSDHLDVTANIVAFYAKRTIFPVCLELNSGSTNTHAANKGPVDIETLKI